jgi:hypothetical protein
MATPKYYTVKPNICPLHSKNHRLVRVAAARKLTGILIAWFPDGYLKAGWNIQCDQVPYLHLGFEIAEAETRINKITIPCTK